MLKDTYAECSRLAGEVGLLRLLTCTFDWDRGRWIIERTDTCKRYTLSSNAYFLCGIEYASMIDRIVRSLYCEEIANMSIVNSLITKQEIQDEKEKKQMKKDSSIAETVYQNTVEAIQDETKDKKKALDAEEQEKLAKAYADLERESMLEHVDKWAEELYARYEALHKKGFADELAIEILKIYISNHPRRVLSF